MAWTDPPTFSVGQTPTSAQWQIIADDLNFLHTPPRCRVYNDANISINNDTDTTLTFNQERYDDATDAMHSTSTNTDRITVTIPGVYKFAANVSFAADADGYRRVSIVHSVTGTIARHEVPEVTALVCVLNPTCSFPMLASEYVTVVVHHLAGAALNVLATSAYSPEFMAEWVAA